MQNKYVVSSSLFATMFDQHLPAQMVGRILDQYGPARRCPPRFSATQLIQSLVFHNLAGPGSLSQHVKDLTGETISDSALAQRRATMPWKVFQTIMEEGLEPKAKEKLHPQAFYHGWRLCAVDGTLFSIANTPVVKMTMSKANSRRMKAAFAKIGAVVMVEVGLHNPIAAAIGWDGQSEMELAVEVLESLPADSLLLGDRYYGVPKVVARLNKDKNRQYLIRVRSNLQSKVLEAYGDGSALVEIRSEGKSMQVREIMGRVCRANGKWTTVRLWTSLLDWKAHPAMELIALYARRWEEEVFYKELKVDMRSTPLVRSHTPETAAQEIAALILAHAILTEERVQAGKVGEVGVLRISFMKTLEAMRGLWNFLEITEGLLDPKSIRLVVRRTLRKIAEKALPKRRKRSCPRAVRQPIGSWPRLTKNTYQVGDLEYELLPIQQ